MEHCKSCRKNNRGCACEKLGICKSLEHDAAKTAGVVNPWKLIQTELFNFKVLVRNAVVLGVNSTGVPTLQALAWMDIETPYDTRTTQNLAWIILEDFFPKKNVY